MKNPGTVLLVDDESGFRENVAEHLQAHGFHILHAGEAQAALAHIQERIVDAALVDVLMPGMDGMTLLGRMKAIDSFMEVVIVTGQGSIESAVEAMRRGAYHYLTKPLRLAELEMTVRRAIEKTLLARQNCLFREDLRRRHAQSSTDIVSCSCAMKRILEEAAGFARTDSTVVIEGETGTGKEVLAEYIHRSSARRNRTFSVLNCGALSDNLLDAELFGHEKGAFTGATEARPGMFEVTDGGTLLLDEISDMAPSAQIRLLRVLERGLIRRVGSTREQAVDVRILAATNRDLAHAVTEGRFREDLYHRLLVFRVQIPPLRERPEDILPLAEHFLARLRCKGAPTSLMGDARSALLSYSWPGNVRELAHVMERARFAAQIDAVDTIAPKHLALPTAVTGQSVLVSLEEAQRGHIRAVLDRVAGNRQQAASILGITERHLYRLLQRINASEKDRGLSS